MSTATLARAETYAPPLGRSAERLRGALLWMCGFSGAFVFMEPSPYEVATLFTFLLFAVTGLRISAALMPLAMMLLLYNIGFSLAAIPVLYQSKVLTWVLVSWYLAFGAFCFAAILGENTEERLSLILRGYIAGALVAASVGILAYFGAMSSAGTFLKYGRVQGTFNDPNVFGAFIVVPMLLLFQRTIVDSGMGVVWAALKLLVLTVGLLLCFSRGAWGMFAFAAALMIALMFVTSRSPRERMRIIGLSLAALVALLLFVAAILSIDRVAVLFTERASFDQSYDTGHFGRFGRHILGFALALESPLGIGPLQFAKIFPEDPHNAYLNAFMSGGWLSGIAYLGIVLTTLLVGFRQCFAHSPWRLPFIALFAAFAGLAGESVIIDTDHWRHYFLVLGLIWGLIGAGYVARRAARRIARFEPAAPPSLAPNSPTA